MQAELFRSSQPTNILAPDFAHTKDNCHQRQNGEERKAKPKRKQVMNDEADKCQVHQSRQRQVFQLPVPHDQNNQAELRHDCHK